MRIGADWIFSDAMSVIDVEPELHQKPYRVYGSAYGAITTVDTSRIHEQSYPLFNGQDKQVTFEIAYDTVGDNENLISIGLLNSSPCVATVDLQSGGTSKTIIASYPLYDAGYQMFCV